MGSWGAALQARVSVPSKVLGYEDSVAKASQQRRVCGGKVGVPEEETGF